MALILLDNAAVISGTICAPRIGAWHADLTVDTEDELTGEVTISINGERDLVGTVDRATQYLGTTQVRVVGGANGLRKAASPKFYRNPSLAEVLRDLANDAGETVSDDSTDAVLNARFNGWTSVKMSIGRLIAELVRPVEGATWRILDDGTLWVGTEAWPDLDTSIGFRELGYDHRNGVIELGMDAPTLMPGVTIGGAFKVDRVEHRIDRDAIRTTAWEFREGEGGRIDHDVLGVARGSVRPFDFFALYAGKMTRQVGQSFDVDPEDDRLPGMANLPIRNGVPALKMTVNPGAKVLVGWRNGDPREPYCALWSGGEGVTSIEFGGGTQTALANGVVLAQGIDMVTGLTFGFLGYASDTVKAKK